MLAIRTNVSQPTVIQAGTISEEKIWKKPYANCSTPINLKWRTLIKQTTNNGRLTNRFYNRHERQLVVKPKWPLRMRNNKFSNNDEFVEESDRDVGFFSCQDKGKIPPSNFCVWLRTQTAQMMKIRKSQIHRLQMRLFYSFNDVHYWSLEENWTINIRHFSCRLCFHRLYFKLMILNLRILCTQKCSIPVPGVIGKISFILRLRDCCARRMI